MTSRNRRFSGGNERGAVSGRARDRHRSGNNLSKHYSIKAVAESLDVSTRTIRRWIANDELVVHRVNGVIRIAEDDLRAFLALHRQG